MEPEISQRTTNGGCLSRRAECFKGIISAPDLNADRRDARISMRLPLGSDAKRRVATCMIGKRMRAMAIFALAISSVDIDSKSMD